MLTDCCRAPITRDWHVGDWLNKRRRLLSIVACAVHEQWLAVSVEHQGINDSLSLSVWTIAHAWSTSAPESSSKTSQCRAPDFRARVRGRWVDCRRGLVCTVAFWWWAIVKQCISDCVSSVYRLLSALVLVGRLQLSMKQLTLPAVVCPILTPWNCTFIPLPLFCRVDVVKFGADACRCVPMCVDASWCGRSMR